MDTQSIVVVVFVTAFLIGGVYAIYRSEKYKKEQYKK